MSDIFACVWLVLFPALCVRALVRLCLCVCTAFALSSALHTLSGAAQVSLCHNIFPFCDGRIAYVQASAALCRVLRGVPGAHTQFLCTICWPFRGGVGTCCMEEDSV